MGNDFRTTWTYTTRHGARVEVEERKASPTSGVLHFIVSLALSVIGVFSLISFYFPVPLGIAFLILGIVFLRDARRRFVKSSKKELDTPSSKIVLYLRSFEDDDLRQEHSVWDELFDPLSLVATPTAEERLERHLRRLGTVVAVGRPNERLPPIGAARLYVDDLDWQVLVEDLIHRADLVVIQSGESVGLSWELQTIIMLKEPNAVVVFLESELRKRAGDRAANYRSYRNWAWRHFPLGVPKAAEGSNLIRFSMEPPWAPELTTRKNTKQPRTLVNRVLRRIISDRHLRHRGVDWVRASFYLTVFGCIFAFFYFGMRR